MRVRLSYLFAVWSLALVGVFIAGLAIRGIVRAGLALGRILGVW